MFWHTCTIFRENAMLFLKNQCYCEVVTQLDKLIVDKHIDQVRSFSYLCTIVNGNNTLEEEIRERIAKGNKANAKKNTF